MILWDVYMKTKIFLIRHGQSVGNLTGHYLGHTDLSLTELGQQQAKATAEALKNEKIDAIYSSDLKRAHETAIPHAEMRNLPINDSKELREIYLGDFEGACLKELKEKHVEDFVIPWYDHFGTYRFPNGESVIEATTRFYNEVFRIALENLGKCILITAHAAVIRGFWCKINGCIPEGYAQAFNFPTNASYSVLYFDGEKFIAQSYSVDSHLNSEVL